MSAKPQRPSSSDSTHSRRVNQQRNRSTFDHRNKKKKRKQTARRNRSESPPAICLDGGTILACITPQPTVHSWGPDPICPSSRFKLNQDLASGESWANGRRASPVSRLSGSRPSAEFASADGAANGGQAMARWMTLAIEAVAVSGMAAPWLGGDGRGVAMIQGRDDIGWRYGRCVSCCSSACALMRITISALTSRSLHCGDEGLSKQWVSCSGIRASSLTKTLPTAWESQELGSWIPRLASQLLGAFPLISTAT